MRKGKSRLEAELALQAAIEEMRCRPWQPVPAVRPLKHLPWSSVGRLECTCQAARKALLHFALLKEHPTRAEDLREAGRFHHAFKGRIPTDLACALLSADPALAHCLDDRSATPLHVAAMYGASKQIVEALLECHPAAATAKDKLGQLALHYGLQYKLAAASTILMAWPTSAALADCNGNLPLHLAVMHHAEADTVRAILLAHPSAVNVRTRGGKTSMKLATAHRATEEVQALLLSPPSRRPGVRYVASRASTADPFTPPVATWKATSSPGSPAKLSDTSYTTADGVPLGWTWKLSLTP
jgi:ankyrin repeat protein